MFDDGNGGSSMTVVLYGLISALRTGNALMDMMIAFLIPALFTGLLRRGRSFWQDIQKTSKTYVARRIYPEYKRQIIHETDTCWSNKGVSTDENALLLKAVRAYIAQVVFPQIPQGSVKLQLKPSARLGEAATKVEKMKNNYVLNTVPLSGQEDESLEQPCEVLPGVWVKEMKFTETVDRDPRKRAMRQAMNERQITKTTDGITLSTRMPNGSKLIDSFIAKAFRWYQLEIAKSATHSRFMYMPLVKKKGKSNGGQKYKRYKLSDEKTFACVFFAQKPKVLRALGHFQNRTGKYAIPGFPHKLGVLLYGPPGTGKTSLVKAIACHTNRHIINVPLSRIRTNQELLDIMYDQVFRAIKVGGSQDEDGERTEKHKHLIKDVVFLLEDIDAASGVVKARDPVTGSAATTEPTLKRESTMMMAIAKTANDDSEGDTAEDDEANDDAEKDKQKEKKKESDDESDKAKSETCSSTKKGRGSSRRDELTEGEKRKKKSSDDVDKLDLAGLLNVLDGILDAPGRILVMTTNHPEQLDPALMRPGRVNMQLFMGFIQGREAEEMVRHFYPTASEASVLKFRDTWQLKCKRVKEGLKMSPARFEQLCAQSENIEVLVSSVLRYIE